MTALPLFFFHISNVFNWILLSVLHSGRISTTSDLLISTLLVWGSSCTKECRGVKTSRGRTSNCLRPRACEFFYFFNLRFIASTAKSFFTLIIFIRFLDCFFFVLKMRLTNSKGGEILGYGRFFLFILFYAEYMNYLQLKFDSILRLSFITNQLLLTAYYSCIVDVELDAKNIIVYLHFLHSTQEVFAFYICTIHQT